MINKILDGLLDLNNLYIRYLSRLMFLLLIVNAIYIGYRSYLMFGFMIPAMIVILIVLVISMNYDAKKYYEDNF